MPIAMFILASIGGLLGFMTIAGGLVQIGGGRKWLQWLFASSLVLVGGMTIYAAMIPGSAFVYLGLVFAAMLLGFIWERPMPQPVYAYSTAAASPEARTNTLQRLYHRKRAAHLLLHAVEAMHQGQDSIAGGGWGRGIRKQAGELAKKWSASLDYWRAQAGSARYPRCSCLRTKRPANCQMLSHPLWGKELAEFSRRILAEIAKNPKKLQPA